MVGGIHRHNLVPVLSWVQVMTSQVNEDLEFTLQEMVVSDR
jgi:hypothetical protein